MVLGHDVTQIIPGKYKGPRFKTRSPDTEMKTFLNSLKMGKEHVYVMELKPGILHEDDAATPVGEGFVWQEHKTHGPLRGQGNLPFKATWSLECQSSSAPPDQPFKEYDSLDYPSTHPVLSGMAVGATRIISLTAPEEQIERVEHWCRNEGPVLDILPYRMLNIGVIVTGNEIFKGRIQDRFDDRVGKKDYPIWLSGGKETGCSR